MGSMEESQPMQADLGLGLQPLDYAPNMQAGMSMAEYPCGLEQVNLYGDVSHCAVDAQDYAFQQELALALDHQF